MQFSFQYLFHFMDDLFPWNCTVDFKLILLDFVIDFAIFTMWLRGVDGPMDKQMDRMMDRQTE